MTRISSEALAYRAGEVDMIGTVYDPGTARSNGSILLFPEAPGPGANVHDRAERLARAGYNTMVADLHGGGVLLQSMDEIMKRLGQLRDDMAMTRLRAKCALDAFVERLGDDTAVAAIGFCFGGTMALELGREGAALAAIAGFHCGLATADPARAARITCPVLVCVGADDPSISAEQRHAFEQEMRAGAVDWTMHVYGRTVHSFTDRDAARMGRPEFARYNAAADKQSWDAMMALFGSAFAS